MDNAIILDTLEPDWSEEPGPGTLVGEHPTVLVIEDESLVAKDITRTLAELGYQVTACVSSAAAALQALDDVLPALILSDIQLKGDLDGIQLAAIVKERFGLPVVFLSSYADESTLSRAIATNPYGYVLKPFRVRELHASLELALRRHSLDARLKHESVTDALTGLYNRKGFHLLAVQQLKVAARAGRRPALFLFDLNGMKAVNDTHGHEAGDQLLLDATRVLRQTFRSSDIVARLGGDEFVVLALEPNEGALDILECRLRTNTEQLNAEDGRRYRLSMSVGVNTWDPAAHRTLGDLLAQADAKMYQAKLAAKKRGCGPMLAVRESQPAPPPTGGGTELGAGLARMLDLRDPEAASHSRLVRRHSRIIARGLGYDGGIGAGLGPRRNATRRGGNGPARGIA